VMIGVFQRKQTKPADIYADTNEVQNRNHSSKLTQRSADPSSESQQSASQPANKQKSVEEERGSTSRQRSNSKKGGVGARAAAS